MKKFIFVVAISAVCIASAIGLTACKNKCKDISLMGAGDRVHDSYTFANTGVTLKDLGDNKFEINGSVDYLSDDAVKQEFGIAENINHVIAIKLQNCDNTNVVADEVVIEVNGVENYDAEHLNGTDYTFIILEAKVGSTTTISVKWSAKAETKVYTIYMADSLQLNAAE